MTCKCYDFLNVWFFLGLFQQVIVSCVIFEDCGLLSSFLLSDRVYLNIAFPWKSTGTGNPLFTGVSRRAPLNSVTIFYSCRSLMWTEFKKVELCLSKGTFPIDTAKTRLQIQGQKLDGTFSELRYKGMFHALSRISKEEGFRALYSG